MVAQRRCERCGRGPFVVDSSGLHYHIGRDGRRCPGVPGLPLTQDEKLRNAADALRALAFHQPTDESAAEWLRVAGLCDLERLKLANIDREAVAQ